MYSNGYIFGNVVGDGDCYNENVIAALAAPTMPAWNMPPPISTSYRDMNNVSALQYYNFENVKFNTNGHMHNYLPFNEIAVPSTIFPNSTATAVDMQYVGYGTDFAKQDVSGISLNNITTATDMQNICYGVTPETNFGIQDVSICTAATANSQYVEREIIPVTNITVQSHASTDSIINNPNIESSTPVFNKCVDHSEWLYNIIMSIKEAEENVEPPPNSNLSDTLKKMLNTEDRDPLTQVFNKPIQNTPTDNTSSHGDQNVSKSGETVNDNNKEYNDFMNYIKSSRETYTCANIKETTKDLFKLSTDYALAQCVSEDLWLSNEIAMHFRWKFDRVEEVYAQKQSAGGLAVLNINGQFIYYLVTKRICSDEAIFQNLFSSLSKMYKHIKEHRIRKLAIARILPDFDGIEWTEVKPALGYLFRRLYVTIKICNTQPMPNFYVPVQLTKCRVINVQYPLVNMEEETIVIYFGQRDGFITDEIRRLNSKFRIIIDYRMAIRNIGDVITGHKNDRKYLLCGFIMKETKDDQFDFATFQKCVHTLCKLNGKRSNKYKYLGIEAFRDDDELIMNKIINILRYSFRSKVDIYICWPEDLKKQIFLPVNKKGECI